MDFNRVESREVWDWNWYREVFSHDSETEGRGDCCPVGELLQKELPGICSKSWKALHLRLERDFLFPLFREAMLASSEKKEEFSLKKKFRVPAFSQEAYRGLLFRVHGIWVNSLTLLTCFGWEKGQAVAEHCVCPSCVRLTFPWEGALLVKGAKLPSEDPFALLKKTGVGERVFQEVMGSILHDHQLTNLNFIREKTKEAIELLLEGAVSATQQYPVPWSVEVLCHPTWSLEKRNQWLEAFAEEFREKWGVFLFWDKEIKNFKISVQCCFSTLPGELSTEFPRLAASDWNQRQKEKRGDLVVFGKGVGGIQEKVYASLEVTKKRAPLFFRLLSCGSVGEERRICEGVSSRAIYDFLGWIHGAPLSKEEEAIESYADLFFLAKRCGERTLVWEIQRFVSLGLRAEHMTLLLRGWKGQEGADEILFRCLGLQGLLGDKRYTKAIVAGIGPHNYAEWRQVCGASNPVKGKTLGDLLPGSESDHWGDGLTFISRTSEVDPEVRKKLWEERYKAKSLAIVYVGSNSSYSCSVHRCVLKRLPWEFQKRLNFPLHLEGGEKWVFVPSEEAFKLFLEFLYLDRFPSKVSGKLLGEVFQIAKEAGDQRTITACKQELFSVSTPNEFALFFSEWTPGEGDEWMACWLEVVDGFFILQLQGGRETESSHQKQFRLHLTFEKAVAVGSLGQWEGRVKDTLDDLKRSALLALDEKKFPRFFGKRSEEIRQWASQ